MKYMQQNGLNLSKIGLGTGRFGTIVDMELSYQMLDTFLLYGGNVIDTARNYYEWVENGRGKSEETIGKWMESKKNRDKVVLSTKGGVSNEGKIFDIHLDEASLLREVRESMQALQTEYLDLYLLHRDEPNRPVEEIMDTLQKVQEVSKAKIIGVCNWQANRVMKANEYAKKHGLIPLQMIQTWWSIADYTPNMWNDDTTTYMDEAMYEYLLEHKIPAMAYTSQAKGFFQKSMQDGYENISDFLKYRIATDENLKRLEKIRTYCNEQQVSPTAVVNGYITDNELEGIALVSCSKMEQLEDILQHCDTVIPREWINEISNGGYHV